MFQCRLQWLYSEHSLADRQTTSTSDVNMRCKYLQGMYRVSSAGLQAECVVMRCCMVYFMVVGCLGGGWGLYGVLVVCMGGGVFMGGCSLYGEGGVCMGGCNLYGGWGL